MRTPRQQALHTYLLAVTKDLIQRGMIRSVKGQKLDDILQAEARLVLADAWNDMKTVGKDLGVEVLSGVVEGAMRAIFGR